MAKKGQRILIKLVPKDKNLPRFEYFSTVNRINNANRPVEVKKFHPVLKKHVEFVQAKIK